MYVMYGTAIRKRPQDRRYTKYAELLKVRIYIYIYAIQQIKQKPYKSIFVIVVAQWLDDWSTLDFWIKKKDI